MDKQKNTPTEQAPYLSKDDKEGTFDRKLKDIIAVTSDYYSEALGKLAGGEPLGGDEG